MNILHVLGIAGGKDSVELAIFNDKDEFALRGEESYKYPFTLGFNVGINVNQAAGQSVFHVHIHLIPRYKGDAENHKGGVRGVIKEKQRY